MYILKDIVEGIDLTLAKGSLDKTIQSIQFDSREVTQDTVFVAICGLNFDGHTYIHEAIRKGATVIVCETLPENLTEEVTYLLSINSAKTLGDLAANFFGNPSAKLKIVGVTGTNGKTTSVTLLHRLFRNLGYNTGLISTVQNQINEDILPTQYTTPNALRLHELFAEMVKKGCTHCFMEVSSHALVQERVAGVQFAGAVFSNITHDHLDYHETFQSYIAAKKKFFDDLSPSAFALVNLDDKRGMIMLQNCDAQIQKTFALKNMATFKAKILENTLQGLFLEIEQREVWFRLIGDFNAYNLLGVYATAILLGEEEENILTELSGLPSVPGRFDQIKSETGTTGIVDYAHTPDALKNVLMTIEQLREEGERVITIVGCGGDRDKTKRPVMAKIACEYSDIVILTSDNPRTEPPMQILEDMQEGVGILQKKKVKVIENRKEAIQFACQQATPQDIVLIAGKGHETYQEIQGVRYPFDDKEILKEFLT